MISDNLKLQPNIITEIKNLAPDFILWERTLHWVGAVNYDNFEIVISGLRQLLSVNTELPINLVVTSPGGATGVSLCFYDLVRQIYKPNLTTIGAGDVDSSGLIIFLTGQKRLITPNTTILLHLAGRTWDADKRFSTLEMGSMLREDKIKDYQYASVVADNSGGHLTVTEVLRMMAGETVLSSEEAVSLGLAHRILN